MKILYISPINIGAQRGDSIHFLEIGENLRRLHHELLVICKKGGRRPLNLNVRYFPNVEIKYLTTLVTDLLSFAYLFSYLFIYKPHVVYYRGVTLGGIISRIFGTPSVAEANGIYPDEIKVERPHVFRLAGGILKLRERINYLLVNKIICITEGIKRELVKDYTVDEKICEVISNGVNINLFKPLNRFVCKKELKFEEKYFYLGFVGSFQVWQGLDTLIEAMRLVKEQGYNMIRCILVGGGDWRERGEEMVSQYGLQKEILFAGRVGYEDVPRFINSFEVCLAPFKKERNAKIGLSPLKLYEYMACARPVISSRVEGVSEVIEAGNCGYLFDPDNVKDLACKIIQSYNERNKLGEMGNNGRSIVERRFSWERVARAVENVLKNAVQVT